MKDKLCLDICSREICKCTFCCAFCCNVYRHMCTFCCKCKLVCKHSNMAEWICTVPKDHNTTILQKDSTTLSNECKSCHLVSVTPQKLLNLLPTVELLARRRGITFVRSTLCGTGFLFLHVVCPTLRQLLTIDLCDLLALRC